MKTVKRKCPVCNKAYLADPGRLKHGRQTTCSRTCSYELRANLKSTSVTMKCSVCETEFQFPPHKLGRRDGAYYCSRECHYTGRRTGLTKRIVTKPYVYTKEGKAALRSSANKAKGQRVFHPDVVCTCCGVKFPNKKWGKLNESGRHFCSNECLGEFQRGENNPAWRGGYPGYYGPDWEPVRSAARERDKVCQRCEKKPKGRHLDVHHLRPVSSFKQPNDANTLDNVVSLCHKCHMHVEWNGVDFKLKFKPRYKIKYVRSRS